MTGDRNTAGHDAAADQNTCVACNNPAAVDDGAVDGAAAEDGDAGRCAGDEVAVEKAAGQERAADDGDAPAPIVPALMTPPLKLVALITMALVWPLNLVGYGPVNAMKFPDALSGQQSARTMPPLYAVEPLPILGVIVSIRWLGVRAPLASAAGSTASRGADQSGFAASVIDAAARLSISHRATETTLVAAATPLQFEPIQQQHRKDSSRASAAWIDQVNPGARA
jgi:hypothetical protein